MTILIHQKLILRKIISGGQTGADQGALVAAKELGLQTGGCMPHGWRTDEGPRPDLAKEFGLWQRLSSSYPPRTKQNVDGSDGTLVFGRLDSPGCKLTIRLASEHRPLICIPWPEREKRLLPFFLNEFRHWLAANEICTLNVAGNRERMNPGIFATTRGFLISALRRLLS